MIPGLSVTNSRSTPIAESSVAEQRLVVVSLRALRDAWVKANPQLHAGKTSIAPDISNVNLIATVVAKTQNAYILRIGNTTVELDLLGVSLELGTELRLRVIDGVAPSSRHAQVSISPNDPTQLSDLGRLLSRVIGRRSEAGPLASLPTSPLATNPESETELGDALQHSITTSGLFYESHLKDWVNNFRSLGDISQEPQANIDKDAIAHGIPNSDAHATEIDEKISANALPIVQRQLETLETQKGAWHTEVWPNQFAQLQIEQEPPSPGSADELQPSWRASIKMHLPNLGEIELAISLVSDSPTVVVTAFEPLACKSLTDARSVLMESLGGAGFTGAVVGVTNDSR